MPCEKPLQDGLCPTRAYQSMGDEQVNSRPAQVTIQGQQSTELRDEAVLLTGNGSRTRRLSTESRTSDARLAMLPATWEGHFGDSAEAAGDRRRACKLFSGRESLGETESALPYPSKTVLQGR